TTDAPIHELPSPFRQRVGAGPNDTCKCHSLDGWSPEGQISEWIRGVAPPKAESNVHSSILSETLVNSRIEDGGERGIRTLGRVSPTHAFQACSFNHSDISPFGWNQQFSGATRQSSNAIVK